VYDKETQSPINVTIILINLYYITSPLELSCLMISANCEASELKLLVNTHMPKSITKQQTMSSLSLTGDMSP